MRQVSFPPSGPSRLHHMCRVGIARIPRERRRHSLALARSVVPFEWRRRSTEISFQTRLMVVLGTAIVGWSLAAFLLASFPLRATASSWRLERLALPPGALDAALNGVSCLSAQDCVAVGDSQPRNFAKSDHGLAAIWNGHRWRYELAAEHRTFDAVSCVSDNICLVTGRSDPPSGAEVAYEFDRTRWTDTRAPKPSAEGAYYTAPAVSCTSAVFCLAVGQRVNRANTGKVLAEHWNGTTWHVQRTPRPYRSGGLDGVSCLSPTMCMAVGSTIELWNGVAWRTTPASVPGELLSVSCVSERFCAAVGAGYTHSGGLAELWNGARWSVHRAPSPPHTRLLAVSCLARTRCVAVGQVTSSFRTGSQPRGSVIESWDGRSWRIRVRLRRRYYLNGISCPTATTCIAVGWYDVSEYPTRPLIEELIPGYPRRRPQGSPW
jgi:hypothetical protein